MCLRWVCLYAMVCAWDGAVCVCNSVCDVGVKVTSPLLSLQSNIKCDSHPGHFSLQHHRPQESVSKPRVRTSLVVVRFAYVLTEGVTEEIDN